MGAGQFAIHGTLRMRAVIEWLKEANFSAVARRMKLSWDEVDGIMSRAVARGLSRREACSPTRIGVDETSFQKRHEYVTVVTNIENSTVIAVMDGRKEEHRELLAEGDATLAKTKYVWLQKPNKMKRLKRLLLTQLIHLSLRTARAWKEWIGWTKNCKLEPMIRAASMVQRHLDGIINAIVLKATNALGESMNAIMFHLGGLDLHPQTASTHTDS